jgi:hypothetical protein
MLISKFPYPQLNRVDGQGGRRYVTPDGSKLPSVTTILDRTKSEEKKAALQAWRNRVGHEKAQQITTEAAGRGTRMHKYLENYVLTGELGTPGTNPYSQQSHAMATVIVENYMKEHLHEAWGSEVSLYYPGLYAGTCDLTGTWMGRPAILDFKQTNKPKKREWIEDYFCQLAAYAMAHNEVYGTDIKDGIVLMCSADFQPQVFELSGSEFEKYTDDWLRRVEQYWSMQ